MSSLKSYMPKLAGRLGLSATTLYERQRALVRVGMLDADEGRGPGSGVRATSGSVAVLLISVLATDSLSEAPERSRVLSISKLTSSDHLRFFAKGRSREFRVAVQKIVSASSVAQLVTRITVSRSSWWADIQSWEGSKERHTTFGSDSREHPIQVSASIDGNRLVTIAEDVENF